MANFTDFVKEKNEKANKDSKRGTINPAERIAFFVKEIEHLYNCIDTEWLKDELLNHSISTGLTQITIREESLGIYNVDSKWLQIGNERVTLQPIGTVMIGTNARVDLIYKEKNVMLVLIGENVEQGSDLISIKVNGEYTKPPKKSGKSVWKYVTKNNRLSYITLTKSSFQNLLMDIMQ